MKKTIVSLLAIAICILCFTQIAMAKEFSDVPTSHWAHEYISKLSEAGVINGYDGGIYKPSGNVTRAEFIKLIVSQTILTLPGMDEYSYLLKTGKNWYDGYVELAKEYNPYIYDDESLNQPITRAEAANILDKFAKNQGYYFIPYTEPEPITPEEIDQQYEFFRQILLEMNLTSNKNISEKDIVNKIDNMKEEQAVIFWERYDELSPAKEDDSIKYDVIEEGLFSDTDNVSYGEMVAISNIAKLKIINGYEDGSFKPDNNLTRAESATVIYRFANVK